MTNTNIRQNPNAISLHQTPNAISSHQTCPQTQRDQICQIEALGLSGLIRNTDDTRQETGASQETLGNFFRSTQRTINPRVPATPSQSANLTPPPMARAQIIPNDTGIQNDNLPEATQVSEIYSASHNTRQPEIID